MLLEVVFKASFGYLIKERKQQNLIEILNFKYSLEI